MTDLTQRNQCAVVLRQERASPKIFGLSTTTNRISPFRSATSPDSPRLRVLFSSRNDLLTVPSATLLAMHTRNAICLSILVAFLAAAGYGLRQLSHAM
jgi:hypothetical protein